MIPLYTVYKKPTLIIAINRLKVKGYIKIYHANTNQKKAGVAVLISYKADFRAKTISKDKGYFIVIKGLIHLENIVILSVYAPHKSSKCMK